MVSPLPADWPNPEKVNETSALIASAIRSVTENGETFFKWKMEEGVWAYF